MLTSGVKLKNKIIYFEVIVGNKIKYIFINSIKITNSCSHEESTMSHSKSEKRLMNILEYETGGKSYKSHKYCVDEIQDTSIEYGEASPTLIWERSGETDKNVKTYVSLKQLSERVKDTQLFSYFLDGSRHVYKVDDMGFKKSGGRIAIYPIMAGQIGVGCCRRENKQLIKEKFINELVVAMPETADADGKKSGFWEAMCLKLNDSAEMKKIRASGVSFAAVIPYKTVSEEKSYNDKGIAKIQSRMMQKEQELVSHLAMEKKLYPYNYLIKDGSLEYLDYPSPNNKKEHAKYKNNYSYVIGVSKRFNPEICVCVDKRPNPGFIADLPLYSRTPVAYFKNEDIREMGFAIWYLRIRDPQKTQTPFDGIIKIEKILSSKEEFENGINTDLANRISAHLINERNPVCFGSDTRWANHLYPIYLTELYVKSRYLSTSTFLHLF